jgi:pilus assembly protein CpaF
MERAQMSSTAPVAPKAPEARSVAVATGGDAGTPPWLAQALARPEITDICLNGPSEAYADSGGGMERLTADGPGEERNPTAAAADGGAAAAHDARTELWSDEDMRNWIMRQLASVGKSWDARHPFIDAALPSGHRLHVAFPPLARQGVLVSLRRLASASRAPDTVTAQLVAASRWSATPGSAAFYQMLRKAIREGDSIILAGATGSGKTTLAGDLLAEVPEHERLLALEDTPELSPQHPHFVSLTSRPPNADGFGEVTVRTLLKQALRMRPDRVILGECRGGEVLDLLQALNTGHRGALATLHANSPRDALRRIELLCLLASQGAVPLPAIRELLATGVQWIAQVKRVADPTTGKARREITELWRVEGREGDTILMRPMVQVT